MKQLMVLMVVLPIMMVFIMQIGLDQRNAQIATVIQACTYAAKEQAKQEGCFTEEIRSEWKENIAKLANLKEENIRIEADSKVKGRYDKDKLIHYKISVKINNVMAANKMFGINDEENSYDFVIESYTASEKV